MIHYQINHYILEFKMQQKAKIRLFVESDLSSLPTILLNEAQSHYLMNVMKCKPEEKILCFDNKNGEFCAKIADISKKQIQLKIIEKTKDFIHVPDIWLLFAPLKKDNTDFIIQKATELGAKKIIPVITKNTITNHIKRERFIAQSIEAAEQSRRVDLPEISEAVSLSYVLQHWEEDRALFFMDETMNGEPIFDAFSKHSGKAAVLCGPEGGFSAEEIENLYNKNYVKGICLGPRILRAETAAVAALSCWQAVCGDWNGEKK